MLASVPEPITSVPRKFEVYCVEDRAELLPHCLFLVSVTQGYPQLPQGRSIFCQCAAGVSALMNMHNAAKFFEQGVFVPTDRMREAGAERQSLAVISRTILRGTPVHYHLVDRLPKGSPDWQRVVAVVVQGAKWQFKDFPIKVGGRRVAVNARVVNPLHAKFW